MKTKGKIQMKKTDKRSNRLVGYVRFKGIGGFQEKLISQLMADDIEISDITQQGGILSATVKAYNYLYVSRTAKKYGIRLKAVKRIGLYYRINKYKKRWGVVVGALCCAASIVFLSQFIWDIRISGNSVVSEGEIASLMEECGVLPGAGRFSFNTRVCELKAMTKIEELSWISVEREGSRIYVKVGENEAAKDEEIPYNSPCNIVSDIDGQIVSAYIKRGSFQSAIGNGIHKGQVLVSGTVDDGGGHILYLHSEAEITARYEQCEEFRLEFSQVKNVPDGTVNTSSYLMLGSYSLPLFWDSYNCEDMSRVQYSEDIYNIQFFGITLPFKMKKGTYTGYTKQEVKYTNTDVLNQLEKQKTEYENNFLADCTVISAEKSFIPDDDGITLKVNYLLERPIGIKQPITLFY